MEDAAKRFGKEKIAVSLQDFDALFKHQHLIEECCGEIVFMHRLDLDSVMNVTDIPCVIVTDTLEEKELFKILKGSRDYPADISAARIWIFMRLKRNVPNRILK